MGPSWCCPPGVAVVEKWVGVGVVVADVNLNLVGVAVGVPSVFPPSAPLLRGARGAAAPWWGSPPTKSDKVVHPLHN